MDKYLRIISGIIENGLYVTYYDLSVSIWSNVIIFITHVKNANFCGFKYGKLCEIKKVNK